jgi:hypothetical protein
LLARALLGHDELAAHEIVLAIRQKYRRLQRDTSLPYKS